MESSFPPSLAQELERELQALAEKDQRRVLETAAGLDFCSNDYLALAGHPKLQEAARRWADSGEPAGAPASRLLRGNTPRHQALERRLARFKGAEAALLMPSGYQANLAVLTTLVRPRDRVLSDALNHASLIDGLRLARCRKVIVPHRDVDAVERALAAGHEGGRTFLVTESLFSMDGTVAPLDRYADLARAHGAELIVDDAHATGIFGENGGGLVPHHGLGGAVAAVVSTFGKAFGLAGACIAGPEVVIDSLVNRARPFVFSTALPTVQLALLEAALDLVEGEPERRRRVFEAARELRRGLEARGFGTGEGIGPIVPVVLGSNRRALAVADHLRRQGFDVRAVRPPTVPEGTARLRISVHADHESKDLGRLAEEIARGAALVDGEARAEAGVVATAGRQG